MNDQSKDQPLWQTPADLKSLESQLGTLEPREDRLNRERLIFLAGQASAELPSKRWAWPASFAAMTALAATMLVMLLSQPTVVPPALPAAERSLTEIRQDFAQRHPPRTRPQGITTATLFREEELEELLHGQSKLVVSFDTTSENFEEEQLRRTILTPSSWNELFDDSTPFN